MDTLDSKVVGEPIEALPRTEAMPSIVNKISSPEKVVLLHRLPNQPTRTNVITEDQVPRSRLFGAYCVRGTGVTLSTIRYPEVVQACFADTRTKRYPFASMQLTSHTYLPCHQDKNNVGCSWLIGLGTYSGGRLWCESPTGSHPPPITKHDWEKTLRGDYVDVNHKWHCFDGTRFHAVEPVTSGERISLTLFTPQGMKRLSDRQLQDLEELGRSDEVIIDFPDDEDTPPAPLEPIPTPDLTSDVWFQGEWALPDPYMHGVDKFTHDAHFDEVGVTVSDGVIPPLKALTAEENWELQEHIRGGHLTKSKHCRACILGSGPMRYHRSLHEDDKMSHCFHVDLAGPFKQSVDCYTYFMVGVLRLPNSPLLFQVELLETRGSPEIAQALSRMVNLIEALDSKVSPLLTSQFLETFLTRNPQLKPNGTAERAVGMIKTLVLRSLTHSKLPTELWSFATLYAAQSLLCKALQRKQRSPPFGSTVIAKRLKPATRLGTKRGIEGTSRKTPLLGSLVLQSILSVNHRSKRVQ
eukprot:2671392-Amphidinium_carterae.2